MLNRSNRLLKIDDNLFANTVKPVLSSLSKEDKKYVFDMGNPLIQVKSIADCSKGEHSAILLTCIKLPSVFKTFVLFIYEWPLKTGFTAL